MAPKTLPGRATQSWYSEHAKSLESTRAIRYANQMSGIHFGDIAIRFIFGGSAIVASTILARRVGGTYGGIFAAFPAVYLAALISVSPGSSADELILLSVSISRGALIGMSANVATAMVAAGATARLGWRAGLAVAVGTWALLAVTSTLLLQRL